ncbi:hypothetical protein E2C01_016701 [Portunus trituberculatus]|uniref:Uncharacterized protein n=1 Tax=Portunus trituberculatus TaxID=210409 RepID=A0A5B7DPT4_PORTR|nr:hypothetical protein [Portunus trituberculatus]
MSLKMKMQLCTTLLHFIFKFRTPARPLKSNHFLPARCCLPHASPRSLLLSVILLFFHPAPTQVTENQGECKPDKITNSD